MGTDFCVRISDNAQEINDPCDPGFNHIVLTGDPSGWYTFRHEFRNNSGVLAVTFI